MDIVRCVAVEIATTLFFRAYKSYCKWCWSTFGDLNVDLKGADNERKGRRINR